jgi:hypothetical protein
MGVAAVGELDFDHLAAKIAEQAAGVGSSDVTAQVDTKGSFKCSGDHARFNSSIVEFSLIAIKKSFPAD